MPEAVAELKQLPQGEAVVGDEGSGALAPAPEVRLASLLPTDRIPQTGRASPPSEFMLGSLTDHRFKVLRPLTVRTSVEHDQVILEVTELNEFGFGQNLTDAIRDLQRTIVQLYLSLEELADEDCLGPDLKQTWLSLGSVIERRR